MRALTLHQPWASLVASGAKLIENRKVRPPASLIGKRFAIHAGGALVDMDVLDRIRALAPDVAIPQLVHLGSILATARLAGAVVDEGGEMLRALPFPKCEYQSVGTFQCEDIANGRAQRRWFTGPIGYVLADVRPLATPITARGKQGFWIVQPGDEAAIREQERAS